MTEDKTYLLRKEEKLFEASLDEFSGKCYELASTNEIIKNADYNKGSFYYRFKTKEVIYFALVDYVYTIQVAEYKANNQKINDFSDAYGLLDSVWVNLEKMDKIDKRYRQLLLRISESPDSIQKTIRTNCVESLLERVIQRLKQFLSGYDECESHLIIQTFLFHYHNHRFLPDILTDDESNHKLTKYVLGKMMSSEKPSQQTSELTFPLYRLQSNLSYLILKDPTIDASGDFVRVSALMTDEKSLLERIRNQLKIRKIDLKNVISAGISHNLRDYSAYLKFNDFEFSEKSYHLLQTIEKEILILVYLAMIGSDNIIVDLHPNERKIDHNEILFTELLPLVAKTSKIIVLASEILISDTILGRIYLLDHKNDLHKIDSDLLSQIPFTSYQVSYLNEHGNLVSKRIAKEKFNFEEYKDKNLLQIKENRLLRYEDLTDREW